MLPFPHHVASSGPHVTEGSGGRCGSGKATESTDPQLDKMDTSTANGRVHEDRMVPTACGRDTFSVQLKNRGTKFAQQKSVSNVDIKRADGQGDARSLATRHSAPRRNSCFEDRNFGRSVMHLKKDDGPRYRDEFLCNFST